jgi:hypothetical protein
VGASTSGEIVPLGGLVHTVDTPILWLRSSVNGSRSIIDVMYLADFVKHYYELTWLGDL